jgi:hypothetical protein
MRNKRTPASMPLGVVQYAASAAAPTIRAANEMAYVNLSCQFR